MDKINQLKKDLVFYTSLIEQAQTVSEVERYHQKLTRINRLMNRSKRTGGKNDKN